MAQPPARRRIAPFNNPVNPLMGGKAGSKDPRGFVSGNAADAIQWDERQFSFHADELADNPPPQYSRAHSERPRADAIARTVPTRINYVPWTLVLTTANVPQLLVPKNLGRLDIVMTPPGGQDMRYSWGFPGKDATGAPLGALLANTLPLPRVGGTVPINDLWVWGAVANVQYLAFEGIDALEANFQ
jgi:hypothetical protein